jgi:cytochrome c
MKRALLLGTLALFAPACLAMEMPKLADELRCSTCHSMEQAGTGPAWIDVSRRYRASRNDPAFINQLVARVSRGGAGNWGSTPMVASDPIGKNHDKITQLVRYILALSDRAPAAQQASLGKSR